MAVEIALDRVCKDFGENRALAEVSTQIQAGQLTGLVGPDGAGKTTLMRIMAALMVPSSGRALVAGADVREDAAGVHAAIGYMPQQFGLYQDLSVQQNLDLYADLRGLRRQQRRQTMERLLAFTNLAPFTRRLAGSLSGGMKQKLGLACALMTTPRILLLDEPSVGVDPISRRELWQMLGELTGSGMTIVWSSAYMDEAERCEDLLLLDRGRIIYAGPPRQLTAKLAGRCYLVRGIQGDRRRLLTQALDLDGIRDGVIQGEAVRLILARDTPRVALDALLTHYQARLEPVPPRFEDAFVDLLGGGPGGRSEFAEKMPVVTQPEEIVVQCRRLSRRFGDFSATESVSFSVKKAEIFGLLGPNGAGKSTTFKMLCGLLKPSAGSAEVVGLDLRSAGPAAKLQLGYMAQKFSLFGLLSVRQNLEFFSGVYGLHGALRRSRIEEMIETFGLAPFLGQSPELLSHGFKQRLALACALMHRPRVLFLDEPTSGVDPLTRREFWTHITGLVERGVTIMVTTHFMEEAEYCDRVALLHRAQLIALDTPDALKARVVTAERPDPTMEDAFIHLVEIHNNSMAREAAA